LAVGALFDGGIKFTVIVTVEGFVDHAQLLSLTLNEYVVVEAGDTN
jgi:hypothetical protein